jgi:hypothetical protein
VKKLITSNSITIGILRLIVVLAKFPYTKHSAVTSTAALSLKLSNPLHFINAIPQTVISDEERKSYCPSTESA